VQNFGTTSPTKWGGMPSKKGIIAPPESLKSKEVCF
jgi:hypothetical protein